MEEHVSHNLTDALWLSADAYYNSYWNEPEASAGIAYIKSSCLSRDASTGYWARSDSRESTGAFCHLAATHPAG